MSTLADNFFCVLVPGEHDHLFVASEKTEIVTTLTRAIKAHHRRQLLVTFANTYVRRPMEAQSQLRAHVCTGASSIAGVSNCRRATVPCVRCLGSSTRSTTGPGDKSRSPHAQVRDRSGCARISHARRSQSLPFSPRSHTLSRSLPRPSLPFPFPPCLLLYTCCMHGRSSSFMHVCAGRGMHAHRRRHDGHHQGGNNLTYMCKCTVKMDHDDAAGSSAMVHSGRHCRCANWAGGPVIP